MSCLNFYATGYNSTKHTRKERFFAEVSKSLATNLKIILLNYPSYYYVECLSIISNAVKSFDILATSLCIIHYYFNGLTKLFSDQLFIYI